MNCDRLLVGHVLLLFISITGSFILVNAQSPATSPKPPSTNLPTNNAQNSSMANPTAEPRWNTYFSSVNYNTYSCWKEGSEYYSTYWSYTSYLNLEPTSYYSYNYNYGIYSYSLVTTSSFVFRYANMYRKVPVNQYPTLSTSCDTINKWSLTPYKCPYSYSSIGSLCTQQNKTESKEFYRSVYSGSSAGSCKYLPQSSYQCNSFYGPVGTWYSNQWNLYSSDVTTCNWLTMYNKDQCYFTTNSSNIYESNVTCSTYSLDYNSLCLPQYLYTSAFVSGGQMSYFYTNGTSCYSNYQPYISCNSCGYERSYYSSYNIYYGWNYYYNFAYYTYNCSTIFSGRVFNAYNVSRNELTSTYLYAPSTSTLVTYTYSQSYSYGQYTYYTPKSVGLQYTELADYNCYLTLSSYSWSEYSGYSTYVRMNVQSNLMCDPYRYTRTNVSYSSCVANISPVSSCYVFTGYSSVGYGLITYQPYQPYKYCNTQWVQNQTCFDCQTSDTPYNSCFNPSSNMYYYWNDACKWNEVANSSCIPRQSTSFSYYSYQCNTFSSNYLSCTQLGGTMNYTSYYNYSSSNSTFLSSNPTWERSWMCREGGSYYTLCNNCRFYWTYSYNVENTPSYYYYSYGNPWRYSALTSSCEALDKPPAACYPEFCLNNGKCVTNGCPSGYPACCTCPADYLGERCETNRTFVMQSTLRMLDPFLPQLLDPSTDLYKNYSTMFTNLWYNITVAAIRETYGDVNTVNLRVVITRFKPGSVIAVITTHGFHYHGHVMRITEQHLRKALTAHCERAGICQEYNLDKTHLTFNATPNVCEDPSMHVCSPHAKCEFHGGVDYTCTCLRGYQDASRFGRTGSVCTEMCGEHTCKNGGSCNEMTNSEFSCNCPTGFVGRFCEVKLEVPLYSLGLMVVIIFLLLVVIGLMIKLRKVQSYQRTADSQVALMIEEQPKA